VRRGESDEIDLALAPVGSEGATQLAETMRAGLGSSDALRIIRMSHARIGPDGAVALALALRRHPSVTELALPGGAIGSRGAQHMAAMLRVNTVLTSVDLTYNQVQETGGIHLARALQHNSVVATLALAGCMLCEHGTRASGAMSDMLRVNKTLTRLDFSSNSTRCAGATQIAGALPFNSTLRDLKLGSNGIRDDGAARLAEAIARNRSITALGIGHNSIGPEGGVSIAEAVGRNPLIEALDLASNAMGAAAARALGATIASEGCRLTDLTLANNVIGDEGATAVASAVKRNGTLRRLDLSTNGIRDFGARSIADAMGLGHDFGLVPPGTPPPTDWRVGMRCEALYQGEARKWFKAVVTKVRDSGPNRDTFGVRYEDGSHANLIRRSEIRPPVNRLDKSTKASRFNRNLVGPRQVNKSIRTLLVHGNLFTEEGQERLRRVGEENPFLLEITHHAAKKGMFYADRPK
jgi:Ran GTPase-activating protein (RanGAP) involved in mRNA processing and transport